MIEWDSPDKFIGTAAAIALGALSAGGAITGAAISSHAAGKAADTQAKSATDALAFQKDQYATAQRNLAPYMSLSQVALPQLTSLAGTHTQNYGLPGNVPAPRASLTSLSGAPNATANPDGMIRMMAPTGEIAMVPAGKRAQYEARGARLV